MARTAVSVGKWFRLLWLTAWALALVLVLLATAHSMFVSGRVTPSAVLLVTASSGILYVVVQCMGVAPKQPPPLELPTPNWLSRRAKP